MTIVTSCYHHYDKLHVIELVASGVFIPAYMLMYENCYETEHHFHNKTGLTLSKAKMLLINNTVFKLLTEFC
jgi:hypothetical protein